MIQLKFFLIAVVLLLVFFQQSFADQTSELERGFADLDMNAIRSASPRERPQDPYVLPTPPAFQPTDQSTYQTTNQSTYQSTEEADPDDVSNEGDEANL
jgi:hypothetical protein